MNISTEPQFPVNPRRGRAPGSASSRRRNIYTVQVKRVIGLRTTPLLPWKFTDDSLNPPAAKPMSARELAASLWRLGLSGGTRVEHSLSNPQNATVSNVFALQQELSEVKKHTRDLEAELLLSKNKVKRLRQKLGHEKSSSSPCHRRECKKIRTLVGNMNNKLRTERHNHKRVERMNSSLVTELASARIRAKTLAQDHEREKKARERAEKARDDLARELGEDRAKMGAWLGEALKFQEEMEQERKMFHMAHVWREERLQMKLAEAKLAFEDKYCYMNKLIAELEAFLQISTGPHGGTMELRRAALIRRAVRSVDVRDIRVFSHASSSRGQDSGSQTEISSVCSM